MTFDEKFKNLMKKKEKQEEKRKKLFKTKGYEFKGYCYYGNFYEFIGEKYSDLRDYVVDTFGWGEWFDTQDRNSALSECAVVVQIDNENGSCISYQDWVKKKKELSYKEFNKWVVITINIENLNRRNSCDYDDYNEIKGYYKMVKGGKVNE